MNKKKIILGIILIVSISAICIKIIIKWNPPKYSVKESKNCNIQEIYQDEKHHYYLDCLEEIKITKRGKSLSLEKALKENIVTLEELLNDAKSKTEEVNGTMYNYEEFSLFFCQRIYEDHVKPNQDIIIGKKNFQIDFTKHCMQRF